MSDGFTLAELAHFARQIWPLWLMLIFVSIAFYAFRPKNRRHFDECANIPFKADGEEPRRHD
ncbi:cbb3-type cytochrome oxidase subunit 3 [Dongia sp.]|uniref:cbb3-type cytochrome oxidase subunit 3 n=1 Tax=Dongia sp. TaxID=1977262 RepID=UPI0035B49095